MTALLVGKLTQVNDFWREGGLNILSGIVRHSQYLPPNFVDNLLEVRLLLAPAYTRAAMLRAPAEVVALLIDSNDLDDTPEAYASYDWLLQHGLTVASGNPIYTLILNGFTGFYEDLARRYFMLTNARAASHTYYTALLEAAQQSNAEAAEQITHDMMLVSIRFWQQAAAQQARRKDTP